MTYDKIRITSMGFLVNDRMFDNLSEAEHFAKSRAPSPPRGFLEYRWQKLPDGDYALIRDTDYRRCWFRDDGKLDGDSLGHTLHEIVERISEREYFRRKLEGKL